MKKLFRAFAIAALVLTAQTTFAQNSREARVKFMKGDQNAIVADYELPKGVVEDALKEKMEKAGLGKRGSEKGFMAYKGTTWTEISIDKLDVYAKVEGKDNKSTITMLVSKGYDNFISSTSDAEMVQKVQAFLNSFVNDAKAYQLRLAIAAQEEVVKKAERTRADAGDDGNKLQKDREKIEKQIAENQTEQEKKQGLLDTEKKKLEELKAQVVM